MTWGETAEVGRPERLTSRNPAHPVTPTGAGGKPEEKVPTRVNITPILVSIVLSSSDQGEEWDCFQYYKRRT